jgi:uncharacterized protein YjiS (DUF1127 family)
MTKFIATTGQAAARFGFARCPTLVDWIGRYVASVSAERRIRRGIQELKTCDDRLLADMGVYRADIEHVARYGRLPRRGPDGRRW